VLSLQTPWRLNRVAGLLLLHLVLILNPKIVMVHRVRVGGAQLSCSACILYTLEVTGCTALSQGQTELRKEVYDKWTDRPTR
jgi:hypothetical protein